MSKNNSHRMCVAVYTPEAQGFYFGELIGQLQQLCLVKGYGFSLVNTNGYGKHQSSLGIDRNDISIILRNAVHPSLVKAMRKAGKTVVSVGFDYFPLDVPVVSADNAYGIELAFNHLIKNGHRKLAYIGDISQFDLRKRYEAFCDQHEINSLELSENQIYVIDDTLFEGGYAAAREFITRNCGSTGVICGAGLTAVGFYTQLQAQSTTHLQPLEIVAFDALSVFHFTTEDISVIDQNLILLAHKAMETGEKIIKNKDYERHELVLPKLMSASDELYKSGDAFLATSPELSELYNPNYVKTLMTHFYEWPQAIAKSRLDNIMMLEPLFPRLVKEVVLARITHSKHTGIVAKVIRHITHDGVDKTPKGSQNGLCRCEDYPCDFNNFHVANFTTAIHQPIWVNRRLWGVLSIFGYNNTGSTQASSLTALSGYLGLIARFLEHELTPTSQSSENAAARPEDNPAGETETGSIHWHITEATLQWDPLAMRLLGYDSELEKHVYQHMELADRIHPDDESQLKKLMKSAENEEASATLRLLHKNKSYPVFDITCHRGEKLEECTFHLSPSGSNHA
jgi:Transcriptional regulators